eukprot:6176456-Pleurochrysis_carterae.AAC.4
MNLPVSVDSPRLRATHGIKSIGRHTRHVSDWYWYAYVTSASPNCLMPQTILTASMQLKAIPRAKTKRET